MSSLYVISAVGKDKPGLVHSLTNVLSDLNINIVDADARAVRGHFSMFLVVDLITSKYSYEDMVQALETVSANFNLGFRTEKYVAGRRKSNKKLMVLTFMGRDRPGLVASISGILSENSINIEQIKMIARGEYIAIDMTIDTCDFPHTQSLRKVLYKHAEKLGLDISLRNDNIASRPKRVIVFDCDSTIIQQEVIDELAKTARVDQIVQEITNKAMNGDIDFQEALRERVKLLKGMPVEKLELLINTIKLTPGAEELISTLRFM
ncbi:MAG: ACT domain-containing protein, partial [Deltaproteobacteria bacterium]|nr:ACT domain-containing protein [Deltaproteobacteria bacterium]